MSKEKLILDYMNKKEEAFLTTLKQAVLLESPTEGDKGDLQKCREYFANLFEGIGFTSTVIPSNDERYGDHLLLELGQGEEQILFVGHYDTVYEKGSFGELWKQVGSKVWGPGVLDMKGGNIQVYFAIKTLQELDLLPENKKIVFFLSADEEAGSYSSHMHFEKIAKESKAAFVMESAMGDYVGGLKIGRFGRSNYTFTAKGKPAHSGQEPEKAESGLLELAKQATYLEGLTDLDKAMTVAATCLTSGNAGWPTVPGDGELTIDARFSTESLAKQYDNEFQNLKSFNPKVEIITSGGIEKPPFDEKDPVHKALYERAKQVGKAYGIEMEGIVTRGGSDGNFTAAVGCPTLDGMGMTGKYLHQPGKEYINTDQIPVRTAFVASMVLDVLGV